MCAAVGRSPPFGGSLLPQPRRLRDLTRLRQNSPPRTLCCHVGCVAVHDRSDRPVPHVAQKTLHHHATVPQRGQVRGGVTRCVTWASATPRDVTGGKGAAFACRGTGTHRQSRSGAGSGRRPPAGPGRALTGSRTRASSPSSSRAPRSGPPRTSLARPLRLHPRCGVHKHTHAVMSTLGEAIMVVAYCATRNASAPFFANNAFNMFHRSFATDSLPRANSSIAHLWSSTKLF